MGIINVAVSGLNAAQAGILTTSHNIANASTDGYSRQQVVQSTNEPMFTGAGFLGQGTRIETIRRLYSQHLDDQVLAAQTGAAQLDTYLAQIGQIDNLLADPQAGLAPVLSGFFAAVQDVSANPASLASRQALLSASESLADRFNALDTRLAEMRTGVNAQIDGEVTAINGLAQQIATLNQRLVQVQANSTQQPANDLLDQRDVLLAELNTKVRATALQQSDGTYSVFIGNGQPLVVGTSAYTLQAVPAPEDPAGHMLALQSPNGNLVRIPETMLSGGALGGLIAFRSEGLDAAQNALGRIALTLAQNVNDQHRRGQDLTGALGGDYFDMSDMLAPPLPNRNNAGSGTIAVSIAAVGSLSASDYRLTYDGANVSLLRLTDNVATPITAVPQVVDGLSIDISGWLPAAGDSFLIQPTRAAAGNLTLAIVDPRAIAAAAPIRTGAALVNTGTGSISAGAVLDAGDPNLLSVTTLNFVVGGYQVNGAGPVIPYTSGAAIDLNGWRVAVSGSPAAGDVFTIEPNAGGVADNRNMLLLAALQTQNTLADGTANYGSAYAALAAQVGSRTRHAEVSAQAQHTLLDQAQASRAQLSGVNLDEEAANLLRYQQAYQAAAKVISIASTLFDEILAFGR